MATIKNQRLIATWAVCALLVAYAVLWKGGIPGESLILALAHKDTRIQQHIWSIDIFRIRRAMRFQLAIWTLLLALITTWRISSERFRTYLRPRVFQWSIGAACSSGLFLLLLRAAAERRWYPIELLMTNPASVPIFGQRLLFAWIADAVKAILPSLSYINAYYVSQIPAILLTVWIMGRWSALYIGTPLRWIGQLLAVAMLAMTFDYYTFYDIAVVFFYTAGLYLLRQRHYAAFVMVLALGTLNHENISLLVVVAFLETYRKPKLSAAVCGAAVVAYFAVRAIQQYIMPFDRHFDWRVWSNLYFPLFDPKLVAGSAASLLFWWIAAAVSWRSSEIFLKRATILFPLLLVVTYLFGQFQEPRQFDALIPVVTGFILSRLALIVRVPPQQMILLPEHFRASTQAAGARRDSQSYFTPRILTPLRTLFSISRSRPVGMVAGLPILSVSSRMRTRLPVRTTSGGCMAKRNLILTAILAAAIAQSQTPPVSQRTQERIVKEVRHEILTLPFFDVFDNIEFRVDGYNVTLMGQVTQPNVKSDAEKAVKSIEGVENVSNQIEVLPLSPNDDRLRVALYRAIYGFPSLQRYALPVIKPIRIIVKNGHVTLEGVVNNEGDKTVVNLRANGVHGAFSVTNNLHVEK